MLEGLEISEVSLNKVINGNDWHRFDPEYFKKEATAIIENIKNKDYALIGDCFDVSKLAGFEFTEYFTPQNMSSADCYIALTSKNIQRENLVLNEYITIDKTVAKANLQRSKIKYGDVILSYTGEYRRSLVMQDTVEYQLGPNICRIRQKGKRLNPFFLSTFLNSSIGQTILDKEKTLSAQPTVAMSRIRQIPVPICSIQEDIEKIIRDSYKFNNASCKIYDYAEKLLLKELDFGDWQQSTDNISIKTLKDSFCSNGRIDAEYYQAIYEDCEKLLCSYKEGTKEFETICQTDETNYLPNPKKLYKYIELSNIGKYGNIVGCTECEGSELPTRARRKVKRGDVIVSSIEGSLDSCALITEDYDEALCSTGFYVVRSTFYNPETLLVLFKSKPFQMLMKKGCSGTILTAISKNEIDKIQFPLIDKSIQSRLSTFIQESFALRRKSERLLEVAKKAVEIAISDTEESALEFITKETRTSIL